MTKASLRVWINWDPDGTGVGANLPGPNVMEIDINVAKGDEPVGITITDETFSMTSKNEPRLVTIPDERGCGVFDAGIPHHGHEWTVQSHTFTCAGVPVPPIHPEATVDENIAHVLRALRDGAAMTRANSAFTDLLRHFGVPEIRFATDDLDGFLEDDDATEWITNERKP